MNLKPDNEFDELEEKVLYRRCIKRAIWKYIGITVLIISVMILLSYQYRDVWFMSIFFLPVFIPIYTDTLKYRFIYRFKVESTDITLYTMNIWGKKNISTFSIHHIKMLKVRKTPMSREKELILETSSGIKKYTILSHEIDSQKLTEFKKK